MLHLLKFANTVVKTREDIYADFRTRVNMSPLELEKWLETKTSKAPAEESCESELVIDKKTSHKIIKILMKRKVMLTKGDYECMERVANHIDQLYSSKPSENILVSTWRYALMNLGHDPYKVLEN
jgi:hypothetical protein